MFLLCFSSIDLVHTSHEIDFVKVSEFEKFERVDTFTNTHRMHKTQGESLDFLGIDVNSSCSIRISRCGFSLQIYLLRLIFSGKNRQ